MRAIGDSNALIGGDGNDQLQANGSFNTLDGGTGTTACMSPADDNNLVAGAGNDWLGTNGSFIVCPAATARLDGRDRK